MLLSSLDAAALLAPQLQQAAHYTTLLPQHRPAALLAPVQNVTSSQTSVRISDSKFRSRSEPQLVNQAILYIDRGVT